MLFFRWEFAAIGKKLRKHFETFFSTCKKVFIFPIFARILVNLDDGEGERRSSGGILIPATAQL